jgi:hypothetical protein
LYVELAAQWEAHLLTLNSLRNDFEESGKWLVGEGS